MLILEGLCEVAVSCTTYPRPIRRSPLLRKAFIKTPEAGTLEAVQTPSHTGNIYKWYGWIEP
jgi:hypothetical protein